MDNDTNPQPLSDSEICSTIDRLSEQAIGADDLIADERAEAYEFYYGEPRGELAPSEIEGRSSVVSKDLMECVEWAMPALMDIFCSSDDIVRFTPETEDEEQGATEATDYIGYLIHRKNEDGFTTIHDAVKSALICGMGVGKCYVDKHQEHRTETYCKLTQGQIDLLKEDPEIEIVSQTQDGQVFAPPLAVAGQMAPAMLAPEPTFEVVCKLSEDVIQFKNEGVPPEELRISKNTRVLSDVDFIEHRRQVTLSWLREQGYPEDLIDSLPTDDSGNINVNDDKEARYEEDEENPIGDEAADDSQRLVWLSESYLRLDIHGTGRTEYYRILKVNNTVFEKDPWDDHPFWWMSPLLMPYKIMGLSFFDLVEDLQRIQTSLKRGLLDNAYLVNNPMKEVVTKNILSIDELLSPRVGGLVQVKAANSVREMTTASILAPGLELVNAFDATRDSRTGVTEMNSALNAESLASSNVGSMGVQAMMSAGGQRLRLVARVLVETGFRRMYQLMLKNVSQYQDRPQQQKINGKWLTVNPREWKNKYNMSVGVGVGTFSKQEQIQNLRNIGAVQKDLMPLGLVKPQNVYQTAKRTIEAMGFRDADQFITAPAEGQPAPQQQQPQMSPEAQAIVAAEDIKAKASLAKADKDNTTKLAIAREEIASKERVAKYEAEQRALLERDKAFSEMAQGLARARQQAAMPQAVDLVQ